MREDALLAHVSNLLSTCKDYDFKVLSLEPHYKDGGVLVRFTHSGGRESAEDIEAKLNEAAAKQGGLPSWLGLTGNRGEIWLVKGSLWREVCSHRGACSLVRSDTCRTWVVSPPR